MPTGLSTRTTIHMTVLLLRNASALDGADDAVAGDGGGAVA
jgi:hypothetical protein